MNLSPAGLVVGQHGRPGAQVGLSRGLGFNTELGLETLAKIGNLILQAAKTQHYHKLGHFSAIRYLSFETYH